MDSVSQAACIVDGCGCPLVNDRWCEDHTKFWNDNREPDDYLQVPIESEDLCKVWWCNREKKGRELCSMHLTREAAGRDRDARPKFRSPSGICCIPGCGGSNHSRGYCTTHHSRIQRGQDVFAPLPPKEKAVTCVVEECLDPTRSWNLCSVHYSRKLRGIPMDLPVRRMNEFTQCSVRGCETSHRSRGGCSRHYRQMMVYKVSYEWISLHEMMGCGICGGFGKLQVDHDHNCCPSDREVCGGCNRGMLCFPCNSGLGSFKDSRDLLQKAAKYLKDSSVLE